MTDSGAWNGIGATAQDLLCRDLRAENAPDILRSAVTCFVDEFGVNSIIDDEQLQEEVRDSVKSFDQDLYAERSASAEAGILEILAEMLPEGGRASIPVSELTAAFVGRFGQEYERPITNRFIGGILRKRLRLSTYKSHGVYVVPATEKPKVDQLCIRYGVIERSTCARK